MAHMSKTGVKRTVSAVITRADGTIIDLGIISDNTDGFFMRKVRGLKIVIENIKNEFRKIGRKCK